MTPVGFRRTLSVAAMVTTLTVATWWTSGPVVSTEAQSIPPLTQKTAPNRVGINNANPSFTLDVNGTANATAFRGDGSQLTSVPGATQWSTSGSGIAYASGNVGIGTATPWSRLQISGPSGEPSLTRQIPGVASFMSTGVNLDLVITQSVTAPYTTSIQSRSAVGDGFAFPIALNPLGGKVGIGTASPQSTLDVNGTLSAISKNFKIAHPLDPARKSLVHASLEGPGDGVYYRGEARLVNGSVVIDLPPYFEALTRKDRRTVQLTPIGGPSVLYVATAVEGGRFTVRADNGDSEQRFYWEVKAVRADLAPLVVEPLRAEK